MSRPAGRDARRQTKRYPLGTQPMEMSPPWLLFSQQTVSAELWRRVSTSHVLSRTRYAPGVARTDADDGDRGAREADDDVGPEDDAEQAEDELRDGVVRFDDLLAALHGPGRARRRRGLARRLRVVRRCSTRRVSTGIAFRV